MHAQGGLRGFYASNMVDLNPMAVDQIHKKAGTILGTSRGGADINRIVDALADRGINQVMMQ